MSANDSKPRIITSFEKIAPAIQEQIKLSYPYGFSEELIHFNNKDGDRVSALRFETDERIYLIKMSQARAEELIDEDEDYDDEGNLKQDVKSDFEDKYSDLDYMPDSEEDSNVDEDDD
ncbi:MAG TPA: hypothetical protein VJ949_00200 [Cryomorphaceae bacterium]|nr:hypothetical protein [Cryomorphaceae bacterium]